MTGELGWLAAIVGAKARCDSNRWFRHEGEIWWIFTLLPLTCFARNDTDKPCTCCSAITTAGSMTGTVGSWPGKFNLAWEN
ncbi:hypothetical protein DSM3645_06264 [Blastopirellula marina DSM 3645]|uniref:Uncharacterized protein n=1 Tax=Blastopirellula marina DSM 3645 TaxID=314230 RepID=A4A097_9BACT|nr:hypothetical protein DSM3645_06264 [Blastopirellula marina DSM 3645]